MEASLLLGSHSTVLDQNLHDAGFAVVSDVVRPERRASSKADAPTHRRIAHIEFATGQLANGLALADAVPETRATSPELTS